MCPASGHPIVSYRRRGSGEGLPLTGMVSWGLARFRHRLQGFLHVGEDDGEGVAGNQVLPFGELPPARVCDMDPDTLSC